MEIFEMLRVFRCFTIFSKISKQNMFIKYFGIWGVFCTIDCYFEYRIRIHIHIYIHIYIYIYIRNCPLGTAVRTGPGADCHCISLESTWNVLLELPEHSLRCCAASFHICAIAAQAFRSVCSISSGCSNNMFLVFGHHLPGAWPIYKNYRMYKQC